MNPKLISIVLITMTTAYSTVSAQSNDKVRGYKRESGITWPPEYEPSESRFFIHNETEVKASPQAVWEILIHATEWPHWYSGAKNVQLNESSGIRLDPTSIINWQTMGLKMQSSIKEFNPYQLLSWESATKSIKGYHVWLIIPTPDGCKIITEESQNGWLTFFEKIFQPKKLYRLHNEWLARLKEKAEQAEL